MAIAAAMAMIIRTQIQKHQIRFLRAERAFSVASSVCLKLDSGRKEK